MGEPPALPVAAALGDVLAALEAGGCAVVCAPPGSGKTTLVPPALLAARPGAAVLVTQPRRAAARAVARRMAALRGEPVGGTVGYEVRFDARTSAATRLTVLTEGLLVRRVQRDPELAGVGAVVLDELHERSLQADLALALLREVREVTRPDLWLVAMSATLDAAPVAAYLGGCPVVEAGGRPYPVEVRWAGDPAPERGRGAPSRARRDLLASRVAAGVEDLAAGMDAGRAPPGDVLAFLPGVREIDATLERLRAGPLAARRDLLPLHGSLDARAQDEALAPGPRPRVVVATNLAETSLTLPGVTAVVDGGLARVPRHDWASGLDRLDTERISRASADQRAGRAGRVGPGVALRLWSERDHATRRAFDEPEIRRLDLAGLVLDLRAWTTADPRAFPFLDPPPAEAVEHALALLEALGAVEAGGGRLTPLGERMQRVPAHPRVARALLEAEREGALGAAAWAAAWLQEAPRLPRDGVAGQVAAADVLAWLRAARGRLPRRVEQAARQLARTVAGREVPLPPPGGGDEDAVCRALLAGWPDRVCVRPDPADDAMRMVGGGGVRLDARSVVRGDRLLVALEVEAGPRGPFARGRVRSAARVDPAWLEGRPGAETRDEVRWDAARGRVVAVREARWRDLVLEASPLPLADRAAAAALLAAQAAEDPARALAPDEAATALLRRMALVGRRCPERGLPADPWTWVAEQLPSLCEGRSSLEELRRLDLAGALRDRLPWPWRQALDELAPERLEVPSGSRVRLQWPEEGPPVLPVKVQELFGWTETPAIAGGRQPVVLHLLSPAGRPLQVTSDLRSFWTRTWPEVRKEMRARYPKHRWPEDPLRAEPSARTTRRRGDPS